jgi:hypothetical protein
VNQRLLTQAIDRISDRLADLEIEIKTTPRNTEHYQELVARREELKRYYTPVDIAITTEED